MPVTDWCEHTRSSGGGGDQITSLTESKEKSRALQSYFHDDKWLVWVSSGGFLLVQMFCFRVLKMKTFFFFSPQRMRTGAGK